MNERREGEVDDELMDKGKWERETDEISRPEREGGRNNDFVYLSGTEFEKQKVYCNVKCFG